MLHGSKFTKLFEPCFSPRYSGSFFRLVQKSACVVSRAYVSASSSRLVCVVRVSERCTVSILKRSTEHDDCKRSFPANESSAGISTGSSEDGEQNAHPTSSCLTEGFTIQTKTHVLGCDCDVCTKLRQITKSSCALEDQTVSPKKIIFVGYDGGFVVGKRQQKHHVVGCHCPNCNNYRRRCDTGESVCVKISMDLLHDMVGEARCGQVVFTAATEMQRRAKIGAANKGKCAWNKGKRHSMETIAKIKANTAKAMKNPKVKQRMKEAAARTFHSETTKFKIRRTVRDKANKKMQARNIVRARELGVRKGKVGVCSISMHARRVSSVQLVSYGAWTRDSLDHHDRVLKLRSKRNKQLAQDARKQARNTSEEGLPPPQKPARGTRACPNHRSTRLQSLLR